MVVDRLAVRHGIRITRPESLALVGKGACEGAPILLAKPQTYMNVSGASVRSLVERNQIPIERLLVVYDELALPWGSIRIRT